MPLPHFLVLICLVLVAGALTLWVARDAGVSLAVLGGLALLGAGVARLFARVE